MKFAKILTFLTACLPSLMFAHPHSFLDMKTHALVENQQIIGFQTQWTLDEIASSELIYEVKTSENQAQAKQKITEEMIQTAKNEHYFSYFYNAKNRLIKFTDQPSDYTFDIDSNRIVFKMKFYLEQPQSLTDGETTLTSYEPTYYLGMEYNHAQDVTISDEKCQIRLEQPQISNDLRLYASSLDKDDTPDDSSLGAKFAQKVKMQCE